MTDMEWVMVASLAVIAIGWLGRRRDETIEMPETFRPNQLTRDERLPSMPLEDRTTQFFGAWSEGRRDGIRIAFQSYGKAIAIFAGDFDADVEQLSEAYLSHVGDGRVLPREGSPGRISVALEGSHPELDARFFLNATGPDYGQLRNQRVCDALLELSDAIAEIILFEAGGVQLITDETASTESLLSDLDVAISLSRALS
jgi:hypothetical protein